LIISDSSLIHFIKKTTTNSKLFSVYVRSLSLIDDCKIIQIVIQFLINCLIHSLIIKNMENISKIGKNFVKLILKLNFFNV